MSENSCLGEEFEIRNETGQKVHVIEIPPEVELSTKLKLQIWKRAIDAAKEGDFDIQYIKYDGLGKGGQVRITYK